MVVFDLVIEVSVLRGKKMETCLLLLIEEYMNPNHAISCFLLKLMKMYYIILPLFMFFWICFIFLKGDLKVILLFYFVFIG